MTKKTKKVAKKAKVLKVEIVEPVVKDGVFTLKKEPEVVEPVLLPSEPNPEPVVSPNEPKIEGIDEGYKRPSITNVKSVYTKKQFEALIKGYWERFPDMEAKNPAKYEAKKSELAKKLADIK